MDLKKQNIWERCWPRWKGGHVETFIDAGRDRRGF